MKDIEENMDQARRLADVTTIKTNIPNIFINILELPPLVMSILM